MTDFAGFHFDLFLKLILLLNLLLIFYISLSTPPTVPDTVPDPTLPPVGLLNQNLLYMELRHLTHFGPEDGGCMYLRKVYNAAHIYSVQRFKRRINKNKHNLNEIE
jgi:hypothetical protein